MDARTFAIADTSVTCELMRTRLAEPMRNTVSTEKAALAVAALVAGFGVLFWLDDVVTRTLHLPKN